MTRPESRLRPVRRAPRWSRAERLVRAGAAALLVLVGYGMVSFTLAGVIKHDARQAHALAPYDGRITARLAAAIGGAEADAADRRQAAVLAANALRQDPVNVTAASTLGLNAQVGGDATTARRAFAYAERLSRRDTITQLWAIEAAVARGDVAAVLRHYDIALRVKPELGGVLFPILIAASGEAAIRSALVRTLAARPAWQEPFVNFAASRADDAPMVAALFRDLRPAGVPIPAAAGASLVDALLSRGQIDGAWAYYAAIRPGASRNGSRDPRFDARIEVPTRFDWRPIESGGISGAIEAGAFDFSAPASVGGAMLEQVQLLGPGTYRLTGRSTGIDQPDGSLPYWVLACRDGRELGRVDVPRSDRSGGAFSGVVRVGAECPVQMLTLIARPSEAVSGLSGRIERVELIPAG